MDPKSFEDAILPIRKAIEDIPDYLQAASVATVVGVLGTSSAFGYENRQFVSFISIRYDGTEEDQEKLNKVVEELDILKERSYIIASGVRKSRDNFQPNSITPFTDLLKTWEEALADSEIGAHRVMDMWRDKKRNKYTAPILKSEKALFN